ncbi:uncharacterized protein YwkD [Phoenix dactylifera]|uniref:Uncharacterized protein YwkD n=1 Tax=Phoenix dactylifera TaxID=42345 RepID=A0A8B7CD62_PHODC|nr:uncharacterized protein YwkD [Phoenix dactylifera]
MGAAEGVQLSHIARETSDLKRLADFYQEVLGFERIEAPKFVEFEVIWLRIPFNSSFALHLIERNPQSKLPVSPYGSSSSSPPSPVADPRALSRGHHLAFSVSNFDSLVRTLKEKGIETFEATQPDGKTRQVFFFDPDGNGLEVQSREAS